MGNELFNRVSAIQDMIKRDSFKRIDRSGEGTLGDYRESIGRMGLILPIVVSGKEAGRKFQKRWDFFQDSRNGEINQHMKIIG